jgi:hypothetical protein
MLTNNTYALCLILVSSDLLKLYLYALNFTYVGLGMERMS